MSVMSIMVFLAFGALFLSPTPLHADIYTMKIDGVIETITDEYIIDSFKKVKEDPEATLVIITMDTPGGIMTSMRSIIKAIMDSPVPVVVYVSPKGARAASAGFIVTIAADIAAMAPGTNMGAAHPVAIGQKMDEVMTEKVTNDAVASAKSLAKSRNRNEEWAGKAVSESKSYTAEECLKNNLIEFIAEDMDQLIKQLDQKKVTMVSGKTITLNLTGQKLTALEMSHRQKFLKTITNPNLAYFLLLFGLAGLYLEFTHPGALVPGILGGISLLLAFMAFQVLPINYVGLLLILLSIGFFIAEIKIQGFGIFGIGGIVSFVLGSIMLVNTRIPEMRPAMTTIIAAAIGFTVVVGFLTTRVIKAMRQKPQTGQEGMMGKTGTVKNEVTQTSGKVFVHGEWWNAVTPAHEPIPPGTKVEVLSMDNFVLTVGRVEPED